MTNQLKELNRHVLEIEKMLDDKNKALEHILDVLSWEKISDTTKLSKVRTIINDYFSIEDGEPTTADEFNEEQDSVKIYDIRKDVITVIERIESVEQSLFNIDAKYKKKINEIMFLIEPPPSSQKLINKSKYSKENTNEETSKK